MFTSKRITTWLNPDQYNLRFQLLLNNNIQTGFPTNKHAAYGGTPLYELINVLLLWYEIRVFSFLLLVPPLVTICDCLH